MDYRTGNTLKQVSTWTAYIVIVPKHVCLIQFSINVYGFLIDLSESESDSTTGLSPA